jgi:hypothetical protein
MPELRYFSKSKLMAGAQCAKRLWLEVYAPERAEVSAEMRSAFDAGHEVGAAARGLWPQGVLIGHDQDLDEALRETTERLAAPGAVTLFEATLRANGVLVRTDVLERDGDGRLRLVEVKASTALKPHYVRDAAIQTWVLRESGLAPARIDLGYVNNRFVYQGDGSYRDLFALEDVTAAVEAALPEIPHLIAQLTATLEEPEPVIGIGPQCSKPYDCPFFGYCRPTAEFPVTGLPNGAKVARQLIAQGIHDIRAIPSSTPLNDLQERVRRVTVAGRGELRPDGAATLRALGWPRYYFDFETVSFALPIWRGTRPYQALPFQWSCHVEQADGAIEHREFLAEGPRDPRRECAERLIATLGDHGPVLVYTDYERGVLQDLAASFQDLAPALEAIIARLVDLHPITKANYYHPAMLGSWSLKAVLPTIAPELSYDRLEHVGSGVEAEETFRRLLRAELPDLEQHVLRNALRDYCQMDTEGLIRLARFLEGR